MNEKRISWDQYFMEIAEVVAKRSEDINHKVGCVAVRSDNTIAATGYNGAPPGIVVNWENREEKNKRVIHAEQNSLKWCKPNEIDRLYVTLMPCSTCLVAIAAYGIKKIIYKDEYHRDDSAIQLAKEFGIELLHYVDTPTYRGIDSTIKYKYDLRPIIKEANARDAATEPNIIEVKIKNYPLPITETTLLEEFLVSHPTSNAPAPPGTTISTTEHPDPVLYNEFKFTGSKLVEVNNIGQNLHCGDFRTILMWPPDKLKDNNQTISATEITRMIASTEKEIDRLRVLQTQLDISMKNQLLMLQSLKIQRSGDKVLADARYS